eukprot:CAMPEP_0119060992 /NCGR_PEP_ID=MMETSP1178-20130426/4873_1 /TAXON_ID=33656 /ORGANISM="unid sp, Strain CCMP2000" /LENGTH=43 /DNA_ID= /DNA_START= /DNA_END= /DNA_ORIENTATION=
MRRLQLAGGKGVGGLGVAATYDSSNTEDVREDARVELVAEDLG